MTRSSSSTIRKSFPEFLREAHDLIVASAHNEFLAVAMAPLQGLSRRFWFSHLSDPVADVAEATALHLDALGAIADGNGAKATDASVALNDYLVAFAYATLPGRATQS